MRKYFLAATLLGGASLSCASMQWVEAWKQPPPPSAEGDAAKLLAQADALVVQADTSEEVRELVSLLDRAARIDPTNRRALDDAATFSILLGTGYAEDKDDKAKHFLDAINYAERSMLLNSEFEQRVLAGGTVWDSAEVLGSEDAYAMGWWATAVFYYYKEILSYPSKISNYAWVGRAKALMTRLDEVAPEWEGGGNYFSWAIYYIALPESAGGDLGKAREYLAKADKAGPNFLVNRWGRAKYYHVRTEDRAGFEEDLRWVLQQDPHTAGNPYPWNVYFQTQARDLLARVDDIF